MQPFNNSDLLLINAQFAEISYIERKIQELSQDCMTVKSTNEVVNNLLMLNVFNSKYDKIQKQITFN